MEAKPLSAFTQFSAEKLKKHNLFQTERFFLDVYCLKPGQSQKPHSHEGADKVYVVLEGTCRFKVDADIADHGPGMAIFAPAGSEHGVENPGPADARLLVMMAPAPSPTK